MTNKVKPFYIRITDDMTPQMVQDAFDKCVDAGAFPLEGASGATRKHKYKNKYSVTFCYFGVTSNNETHFGDRTNNSDYIGQEITLEQLDDWLGLEIEQEWNGEGLPPAGVECELKYKHAKNANWRKCKVFAYSSEHGSAAAVWHLDGEIWHHHSINTSEYEFRKLETPEQKAERERSEAAYDLYCARCDAAKWDCKYSFDEFISEEDALIGWLAVVDLTNYRKQ